MSDNHDDLPLILNSLDPALLDYTEWCQVGMALKESGQPLSVWEDWSAKDKARYHVGECAKKWHSFVNTGIGSGTIIHIAKSYGVELPASDPGHALDWDGFGWTTTTREKDDKVIIDRSWVEVEPIHTPTDAEWDPVKEVVDYLTAVFEPDDYVGYVTETWERDGKYLPSQGTYAYTQEEIIKSLVAHHDIGRSLGDYNPDAGAWVRINALDGQGVRNTNVTSFTYALVECDNISKEMQYALIKQLELPVATLVDSGNKSIHALVHVDAADYNEYRKRVDALYEICRKNGLTVDTQNKNPSRLSRLPGIMRGGKKQHLIATNIGKESWAEWWEWIQAINDDLPDPESLSSVWEDLPELAPPLINGVLRQGHKMLIAGPSKAGKSYALIELCISIAEGKPWIGWGCAQGRVLYVNLELDRASALHRFKDVYQAMHLSPDNIDNIDVWNLRGKSVPMDLLAPKLIRRSQKKGYIAVVIDPIYKVITGDENSADQMAAFCNSFDLVASQLGCAVIYCHHHSKGAQGGKRSMDRASGSGVFARDPDALIDMSELELTDECRKQRQQDVLWERVQRCMDAAMPDWKDVLTLDEQAGPYSVIAWAAVKSTHFIHPKLQAIVKKTAADVNTWTAWRLEGTLREFPKFGEKNVWFNYPTHQMDWTGALADLRINGEYVDLFSERGQKLREQGRQKAIDKNKALQEEKKKVLKEAVEGCINNGLIPERQTVADYINDNELWDGEVTKKQIQNWTNAKWSDYVARKDENGKWPLIPKASDGEALNWDGLGTVEGVHE